MRRVLVLGCPGAGKSTLARSLGEALSLPVVHLDKLWWKSGWINRTEGEFDALLDAVLGGERLSPLGLEAVCSIDLKGDEPGLLALCGELGLPLTTYTARELEAVPGEFSASPFVAEITGVDNVCERAALAAGRSRAVLARNTSHVRKGLSQWTKALRRGGLLRLGKAAAYVCWCAWLDVTDRR